nr:unnamed protein product [Callosobruchus chinensis]
MRFSPDNYHYNFFRMNVDGFNRLLKLIEPHILKSDFGREPISPQTRLPITLRYLASGDSMMSLSYLFRGWKVNCVQYYIRDIRCDMECTPTISFGCPK